MKTLLVVSAAIVGLCATPSFAFAQNADNDIKEEIVKPKTTKDWHVYGDVSIALTQFSSTVCPVFISVSVLNISILV